MGFFIPSHNEFPNGLYVGVDRLLIKENDAATVAFKDSTGATYKETFANNVKGYVFDLGPTTAPGSPTEGQIYYDSTAHKLKVRAAAAWETITSA